MAWYRTGTVSVTNGSTAVTGSGTNFVAGAQVGEGFAAPDGRLYEIVTIVSATSLTIGKAYLGSTQTGQTYEIVPTQSLVADLAGQVSALISDFQSVADEAGEGKFDYGTAASPGITFTLDQDTGFFHDTNNEIGVSAGGTKVAEFNSGGLSVTGTITGTSLDMNGNADFGGNIALSRANNTILYRTDDTGVVDIRSATASLSGSSIQLYAGSHASFPNYSIVFGDTMLFRPVDGSPEFMRFVDGTGAVFNENSADLDFRIESDTNTHAFFLQGSNGYVGMGTASPLQPLHVNSSGNTQLLVSSSFNNSTNTGLTVDTVGDSSVARFNVTKSGVTQGTFKYLHAATAADQAWQFTASTSTVYEAGYAEHIWKTGNTERMRITSTGSVGIGTSSPQTNLHVDAGTKNYTGTTPNASSYAVYIESGAAGATGIALGSHNSIPSIQGMGTGTSYNLALCPANGKVAIGHTSPSQALDVVGNIEVSGGIYLGGTAAANLLDDYEEGTWTPAFTPASGAFGSIGYTYNTGSYTKVGRLVTVTGRLQVDGTAPTIGTATGNLLIGGLPFTAGIGQNFYTAMSFTFVTGWASTFAPSSAYVAQNTATAVLVKRASSDGNETIMTAADLISAGANSGFMISATYYTA
jgi:hypothetical protein